MKKSPILKRKFYMKKTIIAILLALGVCPKILADTMHTEIVFRTLMADGTTNVWTQADLVQALGLVNRKYHRDCETPSGRRAWHGRLSKEIVNTNDQTKTEVYADGQRFTYKFKIVTPAQAVKTANAKLATAMTNGIPVSLARARIRRAEEKSTTNIVSEVLTTER